MKIAGLDIGTTGCKLTVFDEQGHDLGKAYRDYPVRRQVSGHEIDLSVVMDSVYAVIREMTAQYPDIGGIGVTSFGETFVMTDASGTPLHTAMLYTDPRGAEECTELVEKLGAESIARISGLAPHEMYSVCKIMWLKKHQPEVYQAAKHIFLIGDYVTWHLTGVAQIDYSLATRSMSFDIGKLDWSEEILNAAGIDVSLLSKPVPTGTLAGCVTKEAAEKAGLNPACQIVTVSHDQVAAAVGAGAFDGDTAVDGAGTVECLTPIYDTLPDIAVMSKGFFSVVPYVIPGKYVAYAFSYTGGALIQWCVNTFAKAEKQEAAQQGISVNTLLEQRYDKQEPTGLLVLPHFAGAATPYMDTGSKGAILGLTAGTTLPDALADSGIRFTKLHATGGGAKSKAWMQMKADILNLPITSLRTSDAGTVGSAMLTGVAVGVFKDLAEAASVMVRQRETYLPNPERHAQYMEIYERYKKVYQAVRPLM